MLRVLCLVVGYLFGLFQTAFIYGKLHGIDIREYGSGNSGTTNMMRTLGKKAGYITYAGDAIKVIVCVVLVSFVLGKNHHDMEILYVFYAGLGVILGHNFPCYMNFKGGKGIAATSGIVLSLLFIPWLWPWSFWIFVLNFGLFFGTLFIFKYVSLASLTFASAWFIQVVVFGQMGLFEMNQAHLCEAYGITFIISALAFIRHRENIKRLLNGTERKIGQKKKEEQ